MSEGFVRVVPRISNGNEYVKLALFLQMEFSLIRKSFMLVFLNSGLFAVEFIAKIHPTYFDVFVENWYNGFALIWLL